MRERPIKIPTVQLSPARAPARNDSFHTYTWDTDGHPVTIDTVGLTYDALGRMVESSRENSDHEWSDAEDNQSSVAGRGRVPQVRAPVLGANLGGGKSESVPRTPPVPDLALSIPIRYPQFLSPEP